MFSWRPLWVERSPQTGLALLQYDLPLLSWLFPLRTLSLATLPWDAGWAPGKHSWSPYPLPLAVIPRTALPGSSSQLLHLHAALSRRSQHLPTPHISIHYHKPAAFPLQICFPICEIGVIILTSLS